MKSIDLFDLTRQARYDALPLELVARHEAGHAVMAHLHGGYIRRLVLGRARDGAPFARAFFVVHDEEAFVAVLSAGVLAMFLHERPRDLSFTAFQRWLRTSDGEIQVLSAASDWMQILRRTGQPSGFGLDDFLERAVRPHFDQAIAKLAGSTDVIDRLTTLLHASSSGIGRRAARRFFAGKAPNSVATFLDRPSVLVSSFLERRAS